MCDYQGFLGDYQSTLCYIPVYPSQIWCKKQGCVIKHGVIIRALLYFFCLGYGS